MRAPTNIATIISAPVITGAADDDPSGIATYSQAGAQFGFGMLWSVFLTTPLMIGVRAPSPSQSNAAQRKGKQNKIATF